MDAGTRVGYAVEGIASLMNYEPFAGETLNQIRRKQRDSATTRPLSHARYDQSHELFEQSSDQQSRILRWLVDFSTCHFGAAESLRVMSVGCGSGILDLPLIESISEEVNQLQYVGIDPNRVACDRFREAFQELTPPGTVLELHEMDIGHLICEHRYDFILAVHSLYYFENPASEIDRLMERLKKDGKLVIFQAPKAELNQLADCFWSDHAEQEIWFSHELEVHLEEQCLPFQKQRIEATVDVTRCFELDDSQGEMIFDFILQTRRRELDEDVLDLCLEFLKQVSDNEHDQLAAPHPVDVFILSR